MGPERVLICFIAATLAAGCGNGGDATARAASLPIAFPVAHPVVRDVKVSHAYVADIRALRHAEIRARFRGMLESVSVDDGQAVTAGQKLFTINARVRRQDVEVTRAATLGAQAELDAARLELQNTQLLADKNVVSPAELARARSKVQIAEAKLAETRAAAGRATVELDRAQIRAPFDGVVNRVLHKAGSSIDEDDLLTTVTDAREVLAYFSISEREYLAYVGGAADARPNTVSLVLADGSRYPREGKIDAIGSELDPDTATLSYRARFANPDGILKHGSSGKVVLETVLHGALLVPQKATFEIQGNIYIYTVDGDHIAHARKLVIKQPLDDAFVVESGITATDLIVVEGIQKLEDGMRITPEQRG